MRTWTLTLLVLFTCVVAQAQTKEIVNILNKRFQQEQKLYKDDEEKPVMTQAFRIVDDTLSFEFKINDLSSNEVSYITRSIPLSAITEIVKDINIIFISTNQATTQTTVVKTKEGYFISKTTLKTDLFFTELRKSRNDEKSVRDKLLKAFKKAGYTITSEAWYH